MIRKKESLLFGTYNLTKTISRARATLKSMISLSIRYASCGLSLLQVSVKVRFWYKLYDSYIIDSKDFIFGTNTSFFKDRSTFLRLFKLRKVFSFYCECILRSIWSVFFYFGIKNLKIKLDLKHIEIFWIVRHVQFVCWN